VQVVYFVLVLLIGCARAASRAVMPAPPTVPPPPPPALAEGGVDLLVAHSVWPGNGEALTILQPDGTILGGYAFDFGGLGGEVSIAGECKTPMWTVLTVRAVGTTRAYWRSPGEHGCPASGADDERCRIGPSEETVSAQIGIDATHVWLVSSSDASRTKPAWVCPR